MTTASLLRDSTQIILPRETIEGLEPQLDDEFAVSVFPEGDGRCRVIGSPVEIKAATEFLARHGISVC
jgi:hypothetical protein